MADEIFNLKQIQRFKKLFHLFLFFYSWMIWWSICVLMSCFSSCIWKRSQKVVLNKTQYNSGHNQPPTSNLQRSIKDDHIYLVSERWTWQLIEDDQCQWYDTWCDNTLTWFFYSWYNEQKYIYWKFAAELLCVRKIMIVMFPTQRGEYDEQRLLLLKACSE